MVEEEERAKIMTLAGLIYYILTVDISDFVLWFFAIFEGSFFVIGFLSLICRAFLETRKNEGTPTENSKENSKKMQTK